MEAPRRRKTRTVYVGGVPVGGDYPISIQSMLKTDPSDVEGGLRCIDELAEAGCQIIRIAVPDFESLEPLGRICRRSKLPVVADIHFNYKLALGAIKAGVSKVRLNPGNLKDKQNIAEVVAACKERNIPIRIGANSGSIKARDKRDERRMVDALLDEVVDYCSYVESLGFRDIIVSLKASDVLTNTVVYRAMAERSDYPLHLGLTATGPLEEGITRSAIALGALLVDGIGDTIRVSLTGDPVLEILTAKDIMRSVGCLFDRPRVVSCPTCGRCGFDLQRVVKEVNEALSCSTRRITVAVMGCIVNGPGEAKECDYGVACSADKAVLFAHGEVVKPINKDDAVKELLALIDKGEARKG
ncbi:MAG: flavodoxin-dependent (E)-4-hydroxy-3-methylbut-2-enyl-diphosphate synthase [Planctomycetota bacterium]